MPRKKILFAEDDEALKTMLARQLESAGYDLVIASDGREALRLVDADPPDLMILDIMLPGLSGFDVLRHVKGKFPDVKTIMVTAYGDLKNAMEARRLGADDFVSKPYEIPDLLFSIERLLYNHSLDQHSRS